MKLNKPHAPYVYATGNAGYDALAVRSPAVADRCLALLDGRSAVFTDFDSLDDQLAVIGKRIAVMYPSTR